MKRLALRASAILAGIALLAACGGGGGDGSGSATPPPANSPPVAGFSATPTSGNAPLTVRFDASSSSDPGGSIASYSWNFGDSTPAGSGLTISHVFQSAGTYTVTLTVADNLGAVSTATLSIAVSNPAVPGVVGLTEAAARTAITSAGFAVGAVTTQGSATVPAGIVIAQVPAGGVSAAPGSQVTFVVSTGTTSSKPPVAVLSGPSVARVGWRQIISGVLSTPSSVTYRWKLIPPSGSAAVLIHRAPYSADLTPDVAGTYRVELTVNDGQQDSNTAVLSFVATHIQLRVVAPKDGGLVSDSARVAATVWSTYEVSSVRASISGREAALTYDPELRCDNGTTCPGFAGTVPLAGLPAGIHVLTVRAVDSRGNADEASISVVHDNPPAIAVTAPLDHSVAMPSIAVDARCSDDLPGCTVNLYAYLSPIKEELLLSAPGFLSQRVDLSRWMGRSIKLLLRTMDSAGQQAQVDRNVYVEDPTRFALVAEVPGEIIDADATRVMYRVVTDSGNSLAIHDRKTTLTQDIPMPAGRQATGSAYLTPTGAIFVADTLSATGVPTGTSGLYLWRGGQLTDLGRVNSSGSLAVGGGFATWNDGSSLYRLDTALGTPQLVSNSAGNWNNSVAADGTVVFWSTAYQIVRDRSGTQTALTSDSSQRHVYPRTDGNGVVYRRSDGQVSNPLSGIDLIVGGTSIPLAAKRSLEPYPGMDYSIENGWVAFTDLGTSQQLHVLTRSPAGTLVRHTDFATSSRIERLAGNGEIMLTNGSKRYFSRGAGLLPISGTGGVSGYGMPYWFDGKWYLAIGRALFEVDTRP